MTNSLSNSNGGGWGRRERAGCSRNEEKFSVARALHAETDVPRSWVSEKEMTRSPSSAKYCAQSNLSLCFEGPKPTLKKKSSECQVSPYFSSLV